MVRDRREGAFLVLAGLAGEDCLLVVEPVNDEREVVERHRCTERDISNGVD